MAEVTKQVWREITSIQTKILTLNVEEGQDEKEIFSAAICNLEDESWSDKESECSDHGTIEGDAFISMVSGESYTPPQEG